jgi:hypothetical protein
MVRTMRGLGHQCHRPLSAGIGRKQGIGASRDLRYPVARVGVADWARLASPAMTITRTGSDDGLLEYRFDVPGLRELVPGMWWRPENAATAAATVLVGYGRTSDKRGRGPWPWSGCSQPRGLNVVPIDAPGHSDRRAADAADWPRPDQDEAAAD